MYPHGSMHGKFFMSDVYGDIGGGTTMLTTPEAEDKQALVDDHNADQAVQTSDVNYKGIVGALLLIVALAFLMGVLR